MCCKWGKCIRIYVQSDRMDSRATKNHVDLVQLPFQQQNSLSIWSHLSNRKFSNCSRSASYYLYSTAMCNSMRDGGSGGALFLCTIFFKQSGTFAGLVMFTLYGYRSHIWIHIAIYGYSIQIFLGVTIYGYRSHIWVTYPIPQKCSIL